jgi:hypothetical protein
MFFGRLLGALAAGSFVLLMCHFKLRDFEAPGYFYVGLLLGIGALIGLALFIFDVRRSRPKS